ncbi:hypothetical protein, partial [Eudoraea chungangensis]|uniref:hypothetical protein n=1 Tax=Eudoraea chungangensis TaxID=1481905 RepID=UPI0023EB4E14
MIKNYSFIFTLLILAITCGFNLKAQDASVEGSWSDPIGFGIVPVAVANLPDGRLITWSSQFRDTYVATGDGA